MSSKFNMIEIEIVDFMNIVSKIKLQSEHNQIIEKREKTIVL